MVQCQGEHLCKAWHQNAQQILRPPKRNQGFQKMILQMHSAEKVASNLFVEEKQLSMNTRG
jgi:hypothetical protein